jgi:capsular polysaccharide biosynthesis protein
MRAAFIHILNSVAVIILIITGIVTIMGEEQKTGYVAPSYALTTFIFVAETWSMP